MPWSLGVRLRLADQDAGAPTDTPTRYVPKLCARLCPPPLRRAIGHARVPGAVREARYGLIPAKNEIRRASGSRTLAHRPAALALFKVEERAVLCAIDGARLADGAVGGKRRVGGDQAQHLPL